MRIDSQLALRADAAALNGRQSHPGATSFPLFALRVDAAALDGRQSHPGATSFPLLALRVDAAALDGRQSHPGATSFPLLALRVDAAALDGRQSHPGATSFVPTTWVSSLGWALGLGLSLACLSGGCARKSGPEVGAVEESGRISTRSVLERAGAAELVGERAIAGGFVGEQSVVLLVDGGGPRYLSLGHDKVVEVCSTAESLRASAKTVAVGCARIGTTPPRVQRIDVASGAITSTTLPDPGATTPTEASWPFVSHGLDRAVVATAAKTTIYDLSDGAKLFAYTSSEPKTEVSDVAFAYDDKSIAVAHNDGLVEVFDITREDSVARVIPAAKADRDPRVAFSPSGKLASASFWGQFALHNLDKKAADYHTPPAAERYGRSGVAFVGDTWIVQLEAGKVVLRASTGIPVDLPTSGPTPARPFAPGLAGGLGFVATGPGDRVLTISADGQTTIVSRIRTKAPK